MGFKDYAILGSLLFSCVLLYIALHSFTVWISGAMGWDYILTFILVLGLVLASSFGIGFFLLPGGEVAWKKKEV
jgi:hypothetical protein